MIEEREVTVRVQKVKKNRIRMKLFFFATLAVLLLLATIFAKQLCPYDPYAQDLAQAMKPPSAAHLMGTDTYGRDMFSRVLIGAQTSISSTFALVAIITVFGTFVGVVCGYYGGRVDALVMRLSDICLAFPGLVFAMAVAAILNGGVQNAVIALALISWPKYSRIARSQTLSIKELPYIQASRLAGDTAIQMIFRHVLPEHHRAGSCHFHAGHRNDDDGDCRSFLSGTGSTASGCRMGKHDEQRTKYAADLSLDCVITGSSHLCICRNI